MAQVVERGRHRTADLVEELKRSRSIEDFLARHEEVYTDYTLKDHLEELLRQKSLKKSEVIRASQIYEIYAYQIFSGLKHPSRDKLLALAIAMELDLEECQLLLRRAQVGELYAKRRRDSILLFGISRGLSVPEMNDLLFEMKEYTL